MDRSKKLEPVYSKDLKTNMGKTRSQAIRILVIAMFQFALLAVVALLPDQHKPTKQAIASQIYPLVQQFSEKNLAQVFLSNTGKIPYKEKAVYVETGLMHHLAISAGQIGPTISFILLLLSCLSRHLPTAIFLRLLCWRQLFSFLFAFWLALVYGATGSLIRVLIGQFFHPVFIDFLVKFGFPIGLLRLPSFFILAAAFTLALLGRNLLHDWSFLFSAAGAHACFFASYAWAALSKVYAQVAQRFLANRKAIPQVWYTAEVISKIAEAAFTQLCCTLLFYPLGAVNLWVAVGANLVVSPIVSFCIVPLTVTLTLLCQFGITQGKYVSVTVHLCDCFLSLFRETAILFAGKLHGPSVAILKPFSDESRSYLLCVLCLGFTAQLIAYEASQCRYRTSQKLSAQSDHRNALQ